MSFSSKSSHLETCVNFDKISFLKKETKCLDNVETSHFDIFQMECFDSFLSKWLSETKFLFIYFFLSLKKVKIGTNCFDFIKMKCFNRPKMKFFFRIAFHRDFFFVIFFWLRFGTEKTHKIMEFPAKWKIQSPPNCTGDRLGRNSAGGEDGYCHAGM